MQFNDKLAVVTGGSSGIGLAIAKELAGQGAKVVITGRDAHKLKRALAEIGHGATGHAVDVTTVPDIERFFKIVRAEHGRVDVLIANAGSGQIVPLGKITEEHFDRAFDTNVKGVLFTVQSALPLMGKGGSVVLIGSTASIQPGPGMSVYGATKGALRTLVRSWVVDIKESGVRINLVSPGPVNTDSLRSFFGSEEQTRAAFAFLNDRSTIGRIGEAEEIGRTVAFLASDAASYINGVELFADGGASQI